MSVNINASTTNGLVLTSDTSGELKLQANGADIATVDSSGITMAAGKTLPASALTGSFPAIDASSLTNIPAANLTGSLPAGMGGKILQVVTKRSDTRSVYSGSNNYSISELSTSITPVSASSLLMIDMHVFYEGQHDQIFKATKDGSVMTASGYEGYNSAAGNQRWSGLAAFLYDNNTNSTPDHKAIRFFDAAGSTTSRTYGLDARTTDSSNEVFYINRAAFGTGSDTVEAGVSFVTIMEIAQ